MSFATAFLALMHDTATITAFASYSTDGYGGPVYGSTSASITGRLVAQQAKVLQRDGTEIAGNHVFWTGTTRTLNTRDKFTVSGSTYEILSIARYPDQDGLHHQKLTLRQGT